VWPGVIFRIGMGYRWRCRSGGRDGILVSWVVVVVLADGIKEPDRPKTVYEARERNLKSKREWASKNRFVSVLFRQGC
jgi:hypothetical protein